jgi:leucyl-tRNA synthetase
LEDLGIGKRKVNYKMRDAAFSRQRYWGEPFPITWEDGVAYSLEENALPLELPYVESYKPGPEGEGPLANIDTWISRNLETNTMPGYAGSSWYFLRYMDPHNENEFCDKKFSDYWNQVDLYVGGTEHAVGHLLYSRMWTKALFDLGHISFDEPYRKLLNQGMIQGSSRFVYRVVVKSKTDQKTFDFPIFVSLYWYNKFVNQTLSVDELEKLIAKYNTTDTHWIMSAPDDNAEVSINPIHVDVNIVDGNILDIDAFRNSKAEYNSAIMIPEGTAEDKYFCGVEVEKMSKSKFNTVNPDDLVVKYGADTFRMYEMFLGPVEMSKPWDTKGIEGVHRFLKKLWRLFADEEKGLIVTNDAPANAELKVLHKTIKKIEEDTERFSYNTAVSAFMVCVNELMDLKCHKKDILQSLIILLTPYAPHISEELWHLLGNADSVLNASFPKLEEKYLVETAKEYPISINGKLRTQLVLDLNADQKQVEEIVLQNQVVQKWLEGKQPKKIIYVKGKMVNLVV